MWQILIKHLKAFWKRSCTSFCVVDPIFPRWLVRLKQVLDKSFLAPLWLLLCSVDPLLFIPNTTLPLVEKTTECNWDYRTTHHLCPRFVKQLGQPHIIICYYFLIQKTHIFSNWTHLWRNSNKNNFQDRCQNKQNCKL